MYKIPKKDYTVEFKREAVRQAEAEGKKPAQAGRELGIRNLQHVARDEWQWIDKFPKIRMLSGEVELDKWLTWGEADKLILACPPHLAALVRFALATGMRAGEITGLG